jgi:hypothetical protein
MMASPARVLGLYETAAGFARILHVARFAAATYRVATPAVCANGTRQIFIVLELLQEGSRPPFLLVIFMISWLKRGGGAGEIKNTHTDAPTSGQ